MKVQMMDYRRTMERYDRIKLAKLVLGYLAYAIVVTITVHAGVG